MIGGPAEIEGIPVCNGGDEQVEPRCAVLLVLKSSIGEPALAVGVDGVCQSVPGLSLVQSGLAGAAQIRLFQPVEREQRPLDAAKFAKGKVKLVLPAIGGKLAQDDRRSNSSFPN